jgi:hypothetical protein
VAVDDFSDISLVLSSVQKEQILQALRKEENSVSMIIRSVLLHNTLPAAKELQLNTSTYTKNVSLARQQLFELAAQTLGSEFAEIELVQKLLEAARTDTAFKYIKQLEKQYETTQKWLLLERLFVEAFRFAQITGDGKLLLAFEKKRNANIERYAEFSRLSGILMREIILHEGFSLRPPDEKQYLKKLQGIQQRTRSLKHYKLIHNSYFIEYMFLSRFSGNATRIKDCIRQMRDNCKQHRDSMDSITLETAELNYINYLCIYSGTEDPDRAAELLFNQTLHSGNYIKSNLCLTMLEYAAFEGKQKTFDTWFGRLQELQDDTKFSPYVNALLAVNAFGKQDWNAFKKATEKFLSDPSRMLFPDMQFFVRMLELYRQLQHEAYDITLMLASIKTLKVFAARNLNKNRFAEDLTLLQYLEKTILALSKHKKKPVLQMELSTFRNTGFLLKNI